MLRKWDEAGYSKYCTAEYSFTYLVPCHRHGIRNVNEIYGVSNFNDCDRHPWVGEEKQL